MFEYIFWIVWLIIFLSGLVFTIILDFVYSHKVWCVLVDGKEYGPVTALDFDARKSEISFIYLEDSCK